LGDNPGAWRHSIEIQPGESLTSIAIRLAPKGHVSVNQLMKHGLEMQEESLPALVGDPEAIRRLAAIGSFDPDDLVMRGWTVGKDGICWRGREMPETWVTPHKRRLAPGRLVSDGDEPVHRRLWQLNVFGCELETGEHLIDICPKCLIELSWVNAQSIVQCQACGFDVRQVSATYAQARELDIARRFFAFYCGDFELPSPFDVMDFRSICHGMEWFAYFGSIWKGQLLSANVQNALYGFEALECWPVSFDVMVRDFFQCDPAEPSTWPEADTTPAWALLQEIDEAQTRELYDLLKKRLAELFRDRHFPVSSSIRGARRQALREPTNSIFRNGWVRKTTAL
jgi:hypothetical protein